MALKWHQPMPQDAFWALERWRLARETGWTMDYIDSLDLDTWQEYWGIRDGEAKAAPKQKTA